LSSDRIHVRVGEELKDRIDNYINKGIVEDNSKLVRQALTFYFENHPYFSDRIEDLEQKVNELASQVDSINQRLERQVDQLSSLLQRVEKQNLPA